ncbi:MAG: hypothetical protein JNM90_09890 [Burkholderiales bacterium]|nr:hypothetical protein [Burkholderiales bacterium]
MKNIMQPAITIMSRLSFGRKNALIGALFCLPIVVLGALLAGKYAGELSFARVERDGVAHVRPARELLQSLLSHRYNQRLVLLGAKENASRMQEFAAKIDATLARLDALDAVNGERFNAARQHAAVKQSWAQIRAGGAALAPEESVRLHNDAVSNVIAYITAVADGSNLSLDPDLDTYYLMDAAMVRLPALVESLAQSRLIAAQAFEAGRTDAPARIELSVRDRLAAQDLAGLRSGLEKVFGASDSAKDALDAALQSITPVVEGFRANLRGQILSVDRPSGDGKALRAEGLKATEELFKLGDGMLSALDAGLEARIARVERSRALALAGVGAVMLLVLYLYVGFMSSVRSTIAAIRTAAARIARGDLSAPERVDTRDELKEIGDAVDEVRRTLKAFAAAQLDMAQQHDRGAISHRIDAGRFAGAYGEIAERVNALVAQHIAVKMHVVDIVRAYASGDLSRDIDRLPGEKAVITEAIDGVKRQLLAINGEIGRLVAAAAAGRFDMRGDAAAYAHTFAEMVDGLNRLMQTCESGLESVSRVLARVAQGDLTARMDGSFQGAFARIQEDCNATCERLGDIVGQVRAATETINTAAREIAMGNTDLSQRTEEQASSLQQTAASMEELNSTVRQNAENARQANQLAASASQIAVKGGTVVDQVVGTMDAIAGASKKIVDIISVIDGIAFQTNILALNAAVEAARAGEQGRGFAVVATEVRNLAQRSANAAREIHGLIGDSAGKVDTGSKLVGEAGATMQDVVRAVKRVTDIMSEIAAASGEQSAGIEQVNQAVAQMDKVTQQNAALVEQAAAAAESMEEQAQALSRTVGVFRLAGAPASGVPTTAGAPRPVRTGPHALPA